MNTQNKIALAGVVAVIVAALIQVLPDMFADQKTDATVSLEAVEQPKLYGPLTVFLGTHQTRDRAGTDSNIGIELHSERQILTSVTFNGGCCDNDDRLERGKPVTEDTFEYSDHRLPDEIKLTLLSPTGNGGHWYGTSVQVSVGGHDKNFCATEDVGELTASRRSASLKLMECQ